MSDAQVMQIVRSIIAAMTQVAMASAADSRPMSARVVVRQVPARQALLQPPRAKPPSKDAIKLAPPTASAPPTFAVIKEAADSPPIHPA